MGACSPLPFLRRRLRRRRARPVRRSRRSRRCATRGIDYRGALYAGLMLTPEGPKLIEYNVRFGDPDSQVVLLRHDVRPRRAAGGGGRRRPRLGRAPTFADDAAVLVVCASEGYPTAPRTGDVIEGLDAAPRVEGVDGARAPACGAGRGRRGSSPPAAGCSTSSARAPTSPTARPRAYEAVGRALAGPACTTAPTSPPPGERIGSGGTGGEHDDAAMTPTRQMAAPSRS